LAATLAVLAVALLAADQAPLLRLALFPALLAPVVLLAWQRGLPPGERAALYATLGGRVALLRRKR
jgi:hypothetical protein